MIGRQLEERVSEEVGRQLEERVTKEVGRQLERRVSKEVGRQLEERSEEVGCCPKTEFRLLLTAEGARGREGQTAIIKNMPRLGTSKKAFSAGDIVSVYMHNHVQ